MQRLVTGLSRAGAPLAVAAPLAVSAHPGVSTHPQNGGVQGASHTTRLAMEEHDGFMHVGLEVPVQGSEVMVALTDLSALGGGAIVRRAPIVTPAPAPAASPLIEEVDSESEASSEGCEANGLMASVDAFNPFEPAPDSGASALDLLALTVTNLLNNDQVVGVITAHLRCDPAFEALIYPGLSASARTMHLEELDAASEVDSLGPQPSSNTNLVVDLLTGIQRGVAVAAVRLGEACCHLGNFLRGLGESLSSALAGMEAASTAPSEGGERRSRNYQVAVVKVSLAVAVLVFTRRMALGRMTMV